MRPAALTLDGSPSAARAGDGPVLAAVDEALAAYDGADAPGLAVAVVADGVVVHARGYGLAALASGAAGRAPLTAASCFRLASVSKQFFGFAAALLEERGLLRFDQALADFFPELPAHARDATVDHLVHHTSGLRDYEQLIPPQRSTQLSDLDVLALLAGEPQALFTPGSEYRYSNGGYVLLGLIIERIAGAAYGRSLAAFLRDEIFRPAGMRTAVLYEAESTPIHQRAYGHAARDGGFARADQSLTSATRGDGAIYASVRDLAAWHAHLDGPLVSPQVRARLFTPGLTADARSTHYGAGFDVSDSDGHARQAHTGSSIGFRTVFERFPAQRFAVAVLANRDDVEPRALAALVAAAAMPSAFVARPAGGAAKHP